MTQNVIDHLVEDHNRIKRLFSEFDSADGSRRPELFSTIVAELARHESAEEEVVYPVLRKEVGEGDALADARISEENEAKEALAELEEIGVGNADFDVKFTALRDDVLEHAEREEQDVFPALRAAVSADRLQEMGKWVERAEATAPTHPHPDAPDTPPGIYAAGPVAAVFDRARDAIRKAAS